MVRLNCTPAMVTAVLMTFVLALSVQAHEVEVAVKKNPHITLQISETSEWTLTYSMPKPAKKLVFMRNPDNSRIKRWQPDDLDFTLTASEEGEIVHRKDEKAFTQVSLKLTPTYVHLAKDYAPFSPFSDGGRLAHSGRFFACAASCNDAPNLWSLKIMPAKGQHVIAKGEIHKGSVEFTDNDSGSNFYVGAQLPVETPAFITVIDNKLPQKLKNTLFEQLPRLMAYFAENLGQANGSKPMLFASYANKPGGSTQGGTLPNQIFMHWDLDNLEEQSQSADYIHQTLWFFAHEAAHFFQKSKNHSLFGETEHSWIHEGGAEWLAAKALRFLYPEIAPYVATKTEKDLQHCLEGIQSTPLKEAAKQGQFRLYYSCGFFIHEYMERQISLHSNGKQSAFDLWLAFGNLVDSGEKINAETFWQATAKWLSQPQINQLKSAIEGSALAEKGLPGLLTLQKELHAPL